MTPIPPSNLATTSDSCAPTRESTARIERIRGSGGAFFLNAAFVVGLLVLTQLPMLEPRPIVRASIVWAAMVLLAWSVLLFGVLRSGQKMTPSGTARWPRRRFAWQFTWIPAH
jgi:hypothetical protein